NTGTLIHRIADQHCVDKLAWRLNTVPQEIAVVKLKIMTIPCKAIVVKDIRKLLLPLRKIRRHDKRMPYIKHENNAQDFSRVRLKACRLKVIYGHPLVILIKHGRQNFRPTSFILYHVVSDRRY